MSTPARRVMHQVLADLLLNVTGLFAVLIFDLVRREMVAQENVKSAQTALEEATSRADTAEEAADEATDDLQRAVQEQLETQAELDQLKRGTPIEFVAAIDASASMSEAIGRLKKSLRAIGTLLPRVTTLRVGLVVYRGGETTQFALSEIKPASEDGGASLNKLLKAIDDIECVGGYANLEEGIGEGLAMLDSSADPAARQVFALLGDMGPGEMDYHTSGTADRLVNQVSRWAQRTGRDRRVLSLYAGEVGSDERSFYQKFSAGPHGAFCEQPPQMFVTTFETIFAPKE